MRFLTTTLICIFALAPAAWAADADQYAGMAELTQVEGRYVVGPWQGALVGGQNCQLQNTEMLGGVEWSLSAVRGAPDRAVQLGAEFLHSQKPQSVTLQLDQQLPVKLSTANSRFGLFYNTTPEQLKQMSAARFATYVIDKGSVSFDLRGFDQAYNLFEKCMKDMLPTRLPNNPLVEGAPKPIKDAPGWQMIELSYDGHPYERLANLDQAADYALGLWVHNRAQYVLNLTIAKGDLPAFPYPREALLTLDNGKSYKAPYIVQADGIIISLPVVFVRLIAKSATLGVAAGPINISYNIKGFAAAAQAIQFAD